MTSTPTRGDQKARTKSWFESLRDQICAEFEKIETELTGTHVDMAPATFTQTPWVRPDEEGVEGGGGVMSVMKGRVFEKVGVNVSTVEGKFSEKFMKEIPGAEEAGGKFWASGISLVAHMQSPLVPAVHMNTRMISTSKSWFGGGGDLNPMSEVAQDTADFHAAYKRACDKHDPAYYPKFKAWCDEYFYIPHRKQARGVGGIFYDNLDSGNWQNDFTFTQDVGKAFLDIYPQLVRRHMNESWSEEQREWQHHKRGLYAEFNLVYDRGTRFGLMTSANPEAVLMSLPPMAKWS